LAFWSLMKHRKHKHTPCTPTWINTWKINSYFRIKCWNLASKYSGRYTRKGRRGLLIYNSPQTKIFPLFNKSPITENRARKLLTETYNNQQRYYCEHNHIRKARTGSWNV
jgi:hypothetical protein